LKTIQLLKQYFDYPIGFSDHSLGTLVPVIAVSLGAVLLEKHLTLDKSMPGPDHSASLEPSEFTKLIDDVRLTERVLSGSMERSSEEDEIKKLVRRSIVAKVTILKGTIISLDMLDFKRPGTGLAPKFIYEVVGKRAKYDLSPDDMVTLDAVE
jgi:N,N'-diacetyllegionaminate synthase